LSICAGKKWLTFATRKRPCGYLGFEGEEKKVYDRLAKLHNAFPNGAFSDLEFNLWSPTKLIPNEAAFKIAYGNKGLALVALDPLKFLVSGEYTKPSDAVNFIYAVERLARDLRCPILLPHHIRKRNKAVRIDPGDLDEIKGAGDYCDQATTVMLLEREEQPHDRGGRFIPPRPDFFTLHFAKVRNAPAALDPLTLHLNRQNLTFEVVEEPRVL
ncbi:MAG: AAA family ATPase, partial [Candidatus Micrarchaeota archaeon]